MLAMPLAAAGACAAARGSGAAPDAMPAAVLDGQSPFRADVRRLSDSLGVPAAADRILGPFSDLAGRVADALYTAVLPGSRSSLHWPFLILTVVFALALYVLRGGRGAKGADGRERRGSLLEYLAPRAIYTHASARVDIGLYLIDRAMMPIWGLAFLGAIAPATERATIAALHVLAGPSPALAITIAWKLVYGLAMLLVIDMCFFFYHLFMHRTRIGWAIHKVHHSAEVLTPLTRMREHFLEAPFEAAPAALGVGVCGGVFAYLFQGGITQITVMNVGIFAFLYTLNGNFRHYHVSFRYPRWLEYWLQSPGMHHTHHSRLPQHWDSNLGLVTSIWDRLFGTLYIAAHDEETPWGLPADEQRHFTTLAQNLTGPFREIGAILRAALRAARRRAPAADR